MCIRRCCTILDCSCEWRCSGAAAREDTSTFRTRRQVRVLELCHGACRALMSSLQAEHLDSPWTRRVIGFVQPASVGRLGVENSGGWRTGLKQPAFKQALVSATGRLQVVCNVTASPIRGRTSAIASASQIWRSTQGCLNLAPDAQRSRLRPAEAKFPVHVPQLLSAAVRDLGARRLASALAQPSLTMSDCEAPTCYLHSQWVEPAVSLLAR